jgi:hypothetical protein
MSALSVSKIDYAIAKLNEMGIRAKGTAEAEELDIIACDAAAELSQLRAELDEARKHTPPPTYPQCSVCGMYHCAAHKEVEK